MANSERIYRSRTDYIIAGVCGGLAKYFKVDPTIVRLVFVILAFGGGSGLLLYLALWLVIPREPLGNSNIDNKNSVEEFAAEVRGKVNEVSENIKNEVSTENRTGGNVVGIVLILFGVTVLLNQIIPGSVRWDLFWPLILILLGLYFIFRKR